MLTTERRPAFTGKSLTACVVVCTATHERATLLRACLDSLLAGVRVPDELLVVVDGNPSLRAELAASLPASVRLLETERRGLSEARNVGIRAATADVIAFVDDDAAPRPEWLSSLMDAFAADDDVLGLGGPVEPDWGAERRWLRDELLWIVGCTYRGHREDAGPIRNPIGCNMAFRRRELVAVGSFATQFGKRGNALETCDETELSLRIERAHGPGRIRYVPAARVRHFVPATRISWRLLVRRSLSEGLAKGRLRRLYLQPALGPERTYARRLVVEAVPRLLFDGLRRRDGRAVMGAVAILLSLLITGGAFVAGAAREARRQARLGVGSEANEVPRHAAS
jgi:glycosyltransferase involved in cell wall biosynthesis